MSDHELILEDTHAVTVPANVHMLNSARSSRRAHNCGSVVGSRLKQNACAVISYRIEWRFLPPQRSLVVLWIVSHFVAVLCDRRHRTGTSTTSQLMKAGGLYVAHLFTRSRCAKDCFKINYNGQHQECWQARIKCLPLRVTFASQRKA